jgi:pilus assembly protein Flp/PilA
MKAPRRVASGNSRPTRKSHTGHSKAEAGRVAIRHGSIYGTKTPAFSDGWIHSFLKPSDYGRGMKTLIRKFLDDESGATAIEYGLIAAGIALAIIATVNGLGSKLNAKFTSINSSLK